MECGKGLCRGKGLHLLGAWRNRLRKETKNKSTSKSFWFAKQPLVWGNSVFCPIFEIAAAKSLNCRKAWCNSSRKQGHPAISCEGMILVLLITLPFNLISKEFDVDMLINLKTFYTIMYWVWHISKITTKQPPLPYPTRSYSVLINSCYIGAIMLMQNFWDLRSWICPLWQLPWV